MRSSALEDLDAQPTVVVVVATAGAALVASRLARAGQRVCVVDRAVDLGPELTAAAHLEDARAHGLDPGDPYEGNGYLGEDLLRVPHTLVDAIELLEGSTIAREAFGEDVHKHLVNTAVQEWNEFNKTVTDWEVRRGFERL